MLVDWTLQSDDMVSVTNAALGDFDITVALRAGDAHETPYAVGNVMWRSPEGQTARGVTRASDVYSFGLVVGQPCLDMECCDANIRMQCVYAVGGADLLLNDCQELLQRGITAEQEIVTRHFCYFGLATQGLLRQVNDKVWYKALESASQFAAEVVKEGPQLKLEYWGKDLGAQAQDIISRMTNPDPPVRPTIEEVMAHSWW